MSTNRFYDLQTKKIDASRVEIDWLIGSYSGIFTFWKERGVVIREIYPLCGVMFPVKFTQCMRLEKTCQP